MSSLLRGTKTAPARGGGRNQKRGGRGRGSGAAESSSASVTSLDLIRRDVVGASHKVLKKSPKKNRNSKNQSADNQSTSNNDDPFKEERLRNASKRENLKGTNTQDERQRNASRSETLKGTLLAQAKRNGRVVQKQVRFTSPLSQESVSPPTSRDSSAEPQVALPRQTTTFSNSIFGKVNGDSSASTNTFSNGQNTKTMTAFGAPASQLGNPSTSTFGASSFVSNNGSASTTNMNPFAKPSTSPFQATANNAPTFGSSANAPLTNGFGTQSFPSSQPQAPASLPKFGAPSAASVSGFSGGLGSQTQNAAKSSPFGSNAFGARPHNAAVFGSTTSSGSAPPQSNGVKFPSNSFKTSSAAPATFGSKPQTSIPNGNPTVSSSKWALEMQKLLRKDGVTPPSWPMKTPGDPAQKGAVEGHWRTYKGYRAKARACLIKNKFIDDPDKPKKLSEAIDFKGTCEGMCPEFEKITRIMENDVKGPEKEVLPGQTTPWPAPHKMIKALARSAAGQDAPLPEDVRSPASLRRTLDYLMDTILSERNLPDVHGFLWDRTRAIRRDFTFQAQSMNTKDELLDQVYCLEQITRFHAIALHQMSPRRLGEKIADDFSEQQEVEQLGKALLSLTHAYEDCKGYKVKCENEAEFRSYYIVFNAHYSGIMETVQDWGWEFWGESDEIRMAINIVEALQNIWDNHGPLKPESPAVIAQNAYSKFFSMVQDSSISYTMACFAEIHFNSVRKSALKTILSSYKKQRDQTKEWTLAALNEILRFDEEAEVEKFCEAYSLMILDSPENEQYLSLGEDYSMDDPFPKLSQLHSSIVERKRGDRPLNDAIHQTVFEEVEEDDNSMFFKDSRAPTESTPAQFPKSPAPAEKSIFGWPSNNVDKENLPPTSNSTVDSSFSSPFAKTTTEAQSISQDIGQSTENSSPFNFLGVPPQPTQADKALPPNSVSSQAPEAKGFTFGSFPKPLTSTMPSPFVPPTSSQKQLESPAQGEVQNFPGIFQFSNPTPLPTSMPTFAAQPASSTPKLPDFASLTAVKSTPPPPPTSGFSFGTPSSGSADLFPKAPAKEKENPLANLAAPQLSSQAIQPSVPSLESRRPAFAEWFAKGVNGVVPNFVEFEVERILLQAVTQFQNEEEARQIREEEEEARKEADAFRKRSLAVKYCQLWRDNAHALWRRREAIEHRRIRAERMEEMKAARDAAKAVDIVAEFTATTKRKSIDDLNPGRSKRRSSEDMLRATGVLDSVHDPNKEIRKVIRADQAQDRTERSESPLVIPPPSSSDRQLALQKQSRKHSRSRSHLSTSMLSDPGYLHGGSRSFLLPGNSAALHKSTKGTNVKTDYFRMKARGIMTLPNGTPIPNSAAKHLLHHKRSFDGISKTTTPRRSFSRPEIRSVPSKPNGVLADDNDDELSRLKERAKDMVNGIAQDKAPNKNKRAYDDDDEELFAKAKRIREQFDEGAEWFREEMRRESLTRSSRS